MPFDIDQFEMLRPYLYHLTYRTNIDRIRRTGLLESATRLLAASKKTDLQSTRRTEPLRIQVGNQVITIRDQKPLHEGSIHFEDGWLFEELVSHLNGFVFFWPGNEAKPIKQGQNHFQKYSKEDSVVLRLPTSDLLNMNERPPQFSKYNSGAPRCHQGMRSPRGLGTFQCANAFPFSPGRVVEVVFRETIMLPSSTEIAPISELGNWSPFNATNP